MDRAAALVPECLYCVALALLYLLANRVGRSMDTEILFVWRRAPILDLGTVAIAILGTNASFCAYTEGLAFTLLFACLLALPGVGSWRLMQRSALAGALAGLAYLSRSQFLTVPIAIAGALAFASLREPRLRRAAGLSLATSLAAILPWVAYLVTSLSHFAPAVLFDFSAYRQTSELSAPELRAQFPSLYERTADLFASFVYAFDPSVSFGYFASFGPIVYALPLSALWLGWRLLHGRKARFEFADHRYLLPVACLGVAFATLAPLQLAHLAVGFEWLFFWRHGLPLVLCLVPAIAWLAGSGLMMRSALTLAVAAGIAFAPYAPAGFIRGNNFPTWPAETGFMRWLDTRPTRPRPTHEHGSLHRGPEQRRRAQPQLPRSGERPSPARSAARGLPRRLRGSERSAQRSSSSSRRGASKA